MRILWGLVLLGGFYPLAAAWRANRLTTLRQALLWAAAAWLAWVVTAWTGLAGPGAESVRGIYVSLCLTGCAGVAVLGARRPGVGAWNFVVAGLLVVLLRPLAEGLGELRLDAAHLLFLDVTLAVGLLNYLPTRLFAAVLALGTACAVEVARLGGLPVAEAGVVTGRWLLAAAPWLGLLGLRLRRASGTEFDRAWLAYRDRFGLVWGQRARELFNRAAANAGWPVVLSWRGLRRTDAAAPLDAAAVLAALQAVLKRFGPEETS